jgi:aminotransferase in exopolysaccharide biosynthesis
MDKVKHVISFIQDQFKTQEFIPLHAPLFIGNERRYISEAIDSTFVSSLGIFVDKFEEMMISLTSTKKAVAVVNGTAAIQVALQLVGVKEGDEVITQALTFVATANAISYNRANPIFIDVDLDTMGLSPQAVEKFLNQNAEIRENGCYNKITGKKISACLPMHTFGFPVHLDELKKICDAWKIPIVEDAAESLGSEYKGLPTGSVGEIGIFSFNGNKIATSGGGGAIVTKKENLGIRGKHLTTTAKVSHEYEFFHDELAFNYRMPNLNAALACAQLEQLDNFLKNKRALATTYQSFFADAGIKFRTENSNTRANYWLMCVELENVKERNVFLKETNAKKVMTRPIWQLLYRLPMYAACQRDEQINAQFLQERIVNIPSSVRYE